ncbi:MAG TPA: hypothetical protein VFU04_00285 [Solirubrobacterales bacterium]|nr:hypothetical protein [Solirubrobacterales bacterium]
MAGMERTMWTDERLSDRFDAIDRRFDGIDRRLDRIEGDIRDLRQLMFQLWGATMVTQLAVIVAIVVTNS